MWNSNAKPVVMLMFHVICFKYAMYREIFTLKIMKMLIVVQFYNETSWVVDVSWLLIQIKKINNGDMIVSDNTVATSFWGSNFTMFNIS